MAAFVDFLADKPWWSCDDEQSLGSNLSKRINTVCNNQSHIYRDMQEYAEAYSGHTELHESSDWQRTLIESSFEENNICRQAVDQLANMVAKSPLIPVAVSDGSWEASYQTKQFNKAIEGEFIYCNMFGAGYDQCRDALVAGNGVIKVNADSKGAFPARVLPYDLIADEWAVRDGRMPCEVFERQFMPMHEIAALFPQKEDQLNAIARMHAKNNVIELYEAYFADEEHGRRVVICDDKVLADEPWRHSWTPHSVFRWSNPWSGFYGVGAVEQIYDIQVQLNAINKFIRVCQERIAVPRIYVDARSGNMTAKFTDGIGITIPFRGRPPVHITPQALTAEIYNERIRLSREEWKMRLRMNDFATSGAVPSRVESGSAMSKMTANQMGLLSVELGRWEQAQKDVATLMIRMLKKANENQPVEVKWNSGNAIERIKWSDVDLDEDRFEIHMEAQNARTLSPGFRLDAIVTRSMVAPMDPTVVNKLLGGDMSAETEDMLKNADLDYVDKLIMEMFRGGDAPVPDPTDPLALHLERTRQAYKVAQTKEAPDGVKQALLDYIDRCKALMTPPEPPPQAPMGPEGMGGMPPEATPGGLPEGAPADPGVGMVPPPDEMIPMG